MLDPLPEAECLRSLRYAELTGVTLLWFARVSEQPDPLWFDPAWLRHKGLLRGDAPGRGTTWFLHLDGRDLVLRHYRRGGAVRHLLGDRYLWTGLHASRPWRELTVQARLHDLGLPVPRPLGACIHRRGGPWYRADLLMTRIPDAVTLAARLRDDPLPATAWRAVGRTLATFHATGFDHADLNAHNILLGPDGRVHLIDFDRGCLHRRDGGWRLRNLRRLRRSLDKLAGQWPGLHFAGEDWRALRAGYDVI